MKQGVYLIGAFHEMVEMLESLGVPILGLIDQCEATDICCSQYPLLGDDQWLLHKGVQEGRQDVVITPDNPRLRKRLTQQYATAGFGTPSFVAGEVSKYAKIGQGAIIQKFAYISAASQLGRGVKVNVGAKVMHDVRIGDYVTIAPSAVILGKVTIESEVYIGANATVLPNIHIGRGATIGAGSVVTKNVADNSVVIGVPAK